MVLTRAQKKQQDNNMSNEAAKTLVKISNTPVYIRQRRKKNAIEEDINKVREEFVMTNLINDYNSIQESLNKTLIETIKHLDQVNIRINQINQIISELNLSF